MTVALKPRQRKMYDDYLASSAASECMERGGARDIASILDDLRKICNHPRLASPSCDGGALDGGGHHHHVATPASFPRVADCTYHRLLDSALDYDPFQQVDLNSLNLVCTEYFCVHFVWINSNHHSVWY